MTVKQAMLRDLGSRDTEFIATIRRVRHRLLDIAGVSTEAGYEAVLIQGSGTYALESVISSTVPRDGKLLVVINGAYGHRLRKIADHHGIDAVALAYAENECPAADDVDQLLGKEPSIAQVAMVHCETTSGIMNPIEQVGRIVHNHRRRYMVDSMSAFGAVPFDLPASHIDFLVSSANKCVEGVPGFAFVICRRDALLASRGCARTLSLDLVIDIGRREMGWGIDVRTRMRKKFDTAKICAKLVIVQDERSGICCPEIVSDWVLSSANHRDIAMTRKLQFLIAILRKMQAEAAIIARQPQR